MGIQSLLEYIETECGDACKAVDLLKIGRGILTRRRPTSRSPGHLRLIVDAEGCLDRLYGGYYSDWACGGQWNRMLNFLNTLIRACHSVNLELLVFFNGALESERLDEWFQQQLEEKRKITQVLKHINNKATPPPKVWWISPVCLRTALRVALRHLGVGVACSMDDHRQEVIAYCREDGFHGLMANDAVFGIFDPPRFFSSHHMKLTYKGALETKEYVLDEVAQKIDLDPKRFCLLGALLGNHILTEEDLKEFYQNICPDARYDQKVLTSKEVISAVIDFVRRLQSVENLEEVNKEVFKNYTKPTARLKEAFTQSIQYYVNGTQEGFLKYRPKIYSVSVSTGQPGSYPGNRIQKTDKSAKPKPAAKESPTLKTDSAEDDDDKVLKADSVYTEGESGYGGHGDAGLKAPEIVIDPPSTALADSDKEEDKDSDKGGETKAPGSTDEKRESVRNKWPKVAPEIMRIASERHQKGLMSPWIYQVLSQGEIKIDITLEEEANRELPSAFELYRPIRQNVYAVLHDLNKKRLIAKNNPSQLPEGALDIVVKEWSIVRSSNFMNMGAVKELRYEEVAAETLEWKCPSLHRLWLGQAVEDKNRRLRAFLSCMKSDAALMLNVSQVPQHLLILCCVLRFMVANRNWRVLRRHELDAFLATAVSPLLHDVETMQEMKLPMINSRGVQLAALFMAGVEAAIFANDACGAPVPWSMCCPWNFFDGKLFHFKLLKANNNTPLIDICDGHVDQMMRVEHMRTAILENIRIDMAFAKPPLAMMPQQFGGPGQFFQGPHHQHGFNIRPAGGPPMGPGNMGHLGPGGRGVGRGAGMNGRGRGRGLLGEAYKNRGPVDNRGGQLQIAGVVVGSWGANTQTHGGHHRGNNSAPPHVTSVGPSRRGRGVVATLANRGRGYVRPAGGSNYKQSQPRHQGFGGSYSPARGPFNNANSKRGKGRTVTRGRPQMPGSLMNLDEPMRHNNMPRGRGCTVEYPDTNGGSILSASQLIGKSPQANGSTGMGPRINGQFNDADYSNFNVYQNGGY